MFRKLLHTLLFCALFSFNISVESDTTNPGQNYAELTAKLDAINISSEQYYTLLLAKKIGGKYGLGTVLMGIAWQESLAGALGPVGDTKESFGERSYGVCQVKRKTARLVMRLYPNLAHIATDEELVSRLMTDKEFNLIIAVHVLLMLRAQGMTEAQMIQTYNRGYEIKHPEKAPYTKHVLKAANAGIPAKVNAIALALAQPAT